MNNFIWLNKKEYPEYQDSRYTVFCPDTEKYKFCVAAFRKDYIFESEVDFILADIFADTKYFLRVNGDFIGTGPVCPGGDYENKLPMPVQYYSTYRLENINKTLNIYADVQLQPTVEADMSCGRGGFTYVLTFISRTGKPKNSILTKAGSAE